MPWLRYLLYFIAVAFITWALTQMEIASPGSLKMHVMLSETDRYGTSEYSPVEIIQAIILGACGVVMWWVARYCPTQRPIAIPCAGLALAFLIRELDFFLDRFVADNLFKGVCIGLFPFFSRNQCAASAGTKLGGPSASPMPFHAKAACVHSSQFSWLLILCTISCCDTPSSSIKL